MKLLSELSAKTLRSYRAKADAHKKELTQSIEGHPTMDTVDHYQGPEAAVRSQKRLGKKLHKHSNRHEGIAKVDNKLKLRVVEDAEQIDEISKETLNRYVPKAEASVDRHRKLSADFKQRALDHPNKKYPIAHYNNPKNIMKIAKMHSDFANQREKYINKAKTRLKEDAVPVNNIGGGAIEGTGIGPKGEPGVPKKRLRVILNKAKMLTRSK